MIFAIALDSNASAFFLSCWCSLLLGFVFIFVFFAFSALSAQSIPEKKYYIPKMEAAKILDMLEATGQINTSLCPNVMRTSDLETLMQPYMSHPFDVYVCTESRCSVHAEPHNRDVAVYDRLYGGCPGTPLMIRVVMWSGE